MMRHAACLPAGPMRTTYGHALGEHPWWLVEETSCDFCEERHDISREVWCAVCDRSVCDSCAHPSGERSWTCPDCTRLGLAHEPSMKRA